MRCSVCNGDLLGDKKVKADKASKKRMLLNGGLMILGGPVVTAFAGLGLACDLIANAIEISRDEIQITCPHCKSKLTLTRAEYKEFEEEVKRIKKEKRKAGQNGIVK